MTTNAALTQRINDVDIQTVAALGTIDILVPNDSEAAAVAVSADDVELDRFEIRARAGRVRDIRSVTPAGLEAVGGPGGSGVTAFPVRR